MSSRMTEEAFQAYRAKRARELAHSDGHDHRVGLSAFIVLGWPPTANTNVRHASGAHYTTTEYKDYKQSVTVALRKRYGYAMPRLAGRLKIEIAAFPPDKRKRDIDNIVKPCLDALAGAGLFENDEQIDDLRIYRADGPGKGTLAVSLWVISHD